MLSRLNLFCPCRILLHEYVSDWIHGVQVSTQGAQRQQMLGGWLPLYTRSRQDQTGPVMPCRCPTAGCAVHISTIHELFAFFGNFLAFLLEDVKHLLHAV